MGTLRDELRRVRTARGELTAEVLVEEATPADHPLHHRFEWDNNVAGHKYRLVQARELIREARVVYRNEKGERKSLREYVAVHADPESPSATFLPVQEVVEDEFTTRVVLAQMKREWQSLKERYSAFHEFAEMVANDLGLKAS